MGTAIVAITTPPQSQGPGTYRFVVNQRNQTCQGKKGDESEPKGSIWRILIRLLLEVFMKSTLAVNSHQFSLIRATTRQDSQEH